MRSSIDAWPTKRTATLTGVGDNADRTEDEVGVAFLFQVLTVLLLHAGKAAAPLRAVDLGYRCVDDVR
jgi:hypothetical protein